MIITYQGDNYFKLQSGDDAVLVDPVDQRSFRGANLILNTLNPAIVEAPEDQDETFWIDHGGEYEVEGTRINGWSAGHGTYNDKETEKTIYRLSFKGFEFALFGFLTEEPSPEIIGELEDVDVAILPVGDDMISASKIAKIMRQIEPSLIVPAQFGDVEPLLKEMNQKECEEDEKIVLKKSDLKAGEMKVHCIQS